MAQVTLEQLKSRQMMPAQATEIGFTSIEGFVQLQRMANLFICSSMVPPTFQGQLNLGNAVIALDMAIRMKANPLAVMQNIYIVHGRPAWSAQFLIATLNKSGRFSALRYKFQGQEGEDSWGCRACATELATGETLEGPLITISLAKKEGWYSKKDKNGKETSKWQTMPELMLRYRAASWFVRAYAPEIAMGLPEAEELRETIDITPQEIPTEDSSVNMKDIEKKAHRGRKPKTSAPAEEADVLTDPAPADSAPEEAVQEKTDPQPEKQPLQFLSASDPIECPNRGGKMIDDWECASCPDRQGCPSWEND